ncbi:hypothetical protein MUP77_08160 [Candidatus Bathyarchaeota archaeon]|nr:hypothetical protein [Candidatus Bathyarchaeota archaeon]
MSIKDGLSDDEFTKIVRRYSELKGQNNNPSFKRRDWHKLVEQAIEEVLDSEA